jgi:transmembrane sensor
MNDQILREASEWLVEFRMEAVGAEARKRFEKWLARSPEHVSAYLEMTAAWEDAAHIDAKRAIDVDALIALARSENDVVELARVESRLVPPAPSRSWLRPVAAAATILVILTAVALGYRYWSDERGIYSTDIGQQRTVTLPDGTTIELNAGTRVRERFTDRERTLDLIAGQAFFRVAKNPARPFVVMSGNVAVRAVGTQFDVYRKESGTTVTVVEGRVAVSSPFATEEHHDAEHPQSTDAEPILLGSGQQLRVAPQVELRATQANIEVATAWTQKKLVFQSASLSEVAEQFNRFNTRKIIVRPEGLEDFLVNGTFPALDPNSLPRFLAFLREQPGVTVDENAERVIVYRNR